MSDFYDEFLAEKRHTDAGFRLVIYLLALVGLCVLALFLLFIIHRLVEHDRTENKIKVQAQKIATLENFVKTVTKHLLDKKLEETFVDCQHNLTHCLSFK